MAADLIPIEDASDLVLLFLHATEKDSKGPLQGATRLQKLLFLLTESSEYQDIWADRRAPLRFRAYKMGPFTAEVYEGLEVLSTFHPPLVKSTPSGAVGSEDVEFAEYADEVDLDEQGSVDHYLRPAEYRLTDEGRIVARKLWDDAPKPLKNRIESIVRTYGRLNLRELLRRVYHDYPAMTVRSEIRDQVGST
jgi:hypothetical protein